MHDLEKFNETSLPLLKEDFCNHLSMQDTTNVECTNAKSVCKDFEIKKLGQYHDLYVQGDTLLQADVLQADWRAF